MQNTSSALPQSLIQQLARPSAAYKLRAWLAVGGLALFMLLYFALAGWFAFTAYRLTFGAGAGTRDAFWGWIIAACAAFLAVFMLKAVVFVKHGAGDDGIEITPQQQPELFRFLHELADSAGAPRPHKVFLSPRVNAAVFYDLSILNFVLPSKKNLEIGLGLVNSLTLGEFRAVLAHEFGHFAQRAMAVGRWAYIGQQIAAHLVARRDKLDDFLNGLSRVDLRIAWVGWVLRLIVWSIRSLVDSVFQVVLLMQRALSREMELNADLVAVSLTGSDALIHALYRLEAADDAWDRALGFVMNEKANGRLTRDVFEVQSHVVAHMGQLFGDPLYGRVPLPADAEPAADRRLFKAELAQPPQMWLTHPLNHEREANAKRRYVAAEIDDRPAWALFADASALRESVTAKLLGEAPEGAVPHDDPLGALGRQFERELFRSCYRGVYFGRSPSRYAATPAGLYGPAVEATPGSLAALYPESLAGTMEQLRALEKEHVQLKGLLSGAVQAPGGVIRHRGESLKRSELPQTITRVERELAQVREQLQAHDRLCRSTYRAAAERIGLGWVEYLEGLAAVMHFADHAEDDLRDLQGLLANTVRIATATSKVSKKNVERIVNEGNALRDALAKVYADAPQVKLDDALLQRIGAASWSEALGEFKLPGVVRETVGDWLGAVDSWVDHTANSCGRLRSNALDLLLLTEARVAAHLADTPDAAEPIGPAPAASHVPPGYATLAPGAERKRQTRLDWWSRFQTADGMPAAAARLLVAGGIVGAVLGLGGTVGEASVTIYNGLARPVSVKIGDGAAVAVPPLGSVTRPIASASAVKVEARTTDGALIEQFDADATGSYGQYIYNVAGAAPLVEWTAVYGNVVAPPNRLLGAPRWTSTSAGSVFTEPPRSISTKGGGGTRTVLSGLGDLSPGAQLGALPDDAAGISVARAHARWDSLDAAGLGEWLWVAKREPAGLQALLTARLAEAPDNVLLRRMEQDTATGGARERLCQRDTAQAAANPQNPDLQYLRVRCMPEGAERERAFVSGHARFPDHGWYAYAAFYAAAGHAQWQEAIGAGEQTRRQVPSMAAPVALDLIRIRRLVGQDGAAEITALSQQTPALRRVLALESPRDTDAPADMKPYAELVRGRIESALQLAHAKPQIEARVLRLAAASDGAAPALALRALALPPDQGVDDETIGATLGLALRSGREPGALEPALARMTPVHREQMLRFAEAIRRGQTGVGAEKLLDGITPELRGQAYSLATVMLGAQAPNAWREGAKRLLFAPERPYFR